MKKTVNLFLCLLAAQPVSAYTTYNQDSLKYNNDSSFAPIIGVCAAAIIAGGAYAAYRAYGNSHDRAVNRNEVIDALERQFLSTIQSEYASYQSMHHNRALYMDSMDHHSILRSILSVYSDHAYPYHACAQDIDDQLNTLKNNMEQALNYMELLATFINNAVAINRIDFYGKQKVISSFFYFDQFTDALPRGPQNDYIRQELILYHSRFETYLQDSGPLRQYLQNLRAAVEQLPEYQQEKVLKKQAELQARQLEEARRLEKERQDHEWRLEQARQQHEKEMKQTPKVNVNYNI